MNELHRRKKKEYVALWLDERTPLKFLITLKLISDKMKKIDYQSFFYRNKNCRNYYKIECQDFFWGKKRPML